MTAIGPDGELQIEERQALRRFDGLSTELTDITEVEYRQLRLERVVLVGVWTAGTSRQAMLSLAELARLAETAGSQVLDAVVQRRSKPDPATYIGSGKVEELALIVRAEGADTVICDGELSPGQLQALEKALQVKVVDRTWLILDIFAQHARSREGKAQVELAQYEYMLPRLRGWGETLSRQTGGIGARRGPGETKLEIDRRRVRTQMARLRRQLAVMARARDVQRSDRRSRATPAVAIVGYTNAGKSSLLNRLTDADVLVQDALFATLDPTVRRSRTVAGREYTVADTVGFVRHLPHQLVAAFRSTLEEVKDADLLLNVIDGGDPEPLGQLAAVREVLAEIGAGGVPELVVVNKVELIDSAGLAEIRHREPRSIAVSAHAGTGLADLRATIDRELPQPGTRVDVLVPFARGELMSSLHEHGHILSSDYTAAGTRVSALVPGWLASRLDALDEQDERDEQDDGDA